MRDCKNCIHRMKNGCDSWDCEFEKRMPNEEAIKVLEMVEAHGIADRAKRAAICALKNEQTDRDLISRQAVIDIVEFECGEWIGLAKTIVKSIEQLPSEEKTDGDLISRQAVITMLNKIENAVEDGDGFQFNEWVEYAKDIPSAEKIAVFKIVGNTKQPYECSKCNEPVDGWDKFCKHCGARLVL